MIIGKKIVASHDSHQLKVLDTSFLSFFLSFFFFSLMFSFSVLSNSTNIINNIKKLHILGIEDIQWVTEGLV